MDTGPDARDATDAREDTGTAGREAGPKSGGRAAQFDAWLALTGQTPPPPGPVRLPMLSGSMSPALPPGCTLVIEPVATAGSAAATVRPGDVVVLARDGRLVAHRVLLRWRWRGQAWLLEMGDANRRGAWRPAAEVVGRVAGATLPDGRALPPPHARRLAWRGLLRHLRGLLLAAPADEGHPPDGPEAGR